MKRTIIKTLGIIALGLIPAFAIYDKIEEPIYFVTINGNHISVRESEYPGNAVRVWHDEEADGNLDAVVTAMATGRGFGWNISKKGENGFDKAAEHYRTEIFPNLK